MPRVFKQSNQLSQKHKRFKGSKKKKQDQSVALGPKAFKTKGIKKVAVKSKEKTRVKRVNPKREEKQLEELGKKIKANNYLDSQTKSKVQELMKKEPGVKIVLFIPFNQDADTLTIKNNIQKFVRTKTETLDQQRKPLDTEHIYPYFTFYPNPKIFPGLSKQNLTFIAADRNIDNIIDYCKVADVICPVLSCQSTNVQGLALDPYGSGKAFDDHGYTVMNILKNQGISNTVSIIQHLEKFNGKGYEKVSRLFRRYFASQFGQGEKVMTMGPNEQEIFSLLRVLQNCNPLPLAWRQKRGYMLAEEINYQPSTKSLEVVGFLKGNCINANQLVHITGIDDFEIQKIEILKSQSILQRIKSTKTSMSVEEEAIHLVQHCTLNDQIYPFHRNTDQHDPNELAHAFQGLILSKPLMQDEQQHDKLQQQLDEQEQLSFDDEPLQPEDKDLEKKQRVEMHMREQDEMEFEDEIDYPSDVNLRQKLIEYRGLTSFRKTYWNPLENLPDEYNRIFVFKDYNKTMKNAIVDNKEKGFAYPGFYVRITIKNISLDLLKKHGMTSPLILSFLLKHQRKMTMVHVRVKRNEYYGEVENPVVSGNPYLVSFGFRRCIVRPIFSRCFNGCDKTKYRKSFVDFQSYYYCSFYYYNTFPPATVAIYGFKGSKQEDMPIMYGQLMRPDPMHIILERVILTGYPFKINKRRATVRFMFFNPKDVKYFKPVELITKLGLRGNIEQSLGTHGLMKCFFSDRIKPHDTICLYLYKRSYPVANF